MSCNHGALAFCFASCSQTCVASTTGRAREHRQQNNHALHATPERSERRRVKGLRDSEYASLTQCHPYRTFSMLAGS